MTSTGTFKVNHWDERPYEQIVGGARLAHASVTQSLHGVIEGVGKAEYLMAHRATKSASFVGLLQVDGTVEGKAGSFVLEVTGTFDGIIARGAWKVITGMGAGDLTQLQGTGSFEAPLGPDGSYSFDYDLG